MGRTSSFIKGKLGEELAVHELARRGITVIERNFRSTCGEIDLIGIDKCEKKTILVFIEVKSWSTYGMCDLEYSINNKKRFRIIETAKLFCQKHSQYNDMSMRFDLLFINNDVIKHIVNAWSD